MDATAFHRLIVKHRTTQNTFGGLIGAYVLSLIAIICAIGVFDDKRSLLVFYFMNLIVLIVFCSGLIRWVICSPLLA